MQRECLGPNHWSSRLARGSASLGDTSPAEVGDGVGRTGIAKALRFYFISSVGL